ncbi:hypothetical protein EVAR_28608_1 [Eumeta japonica]|uniref:Uncharacterized protein n=1 Tax=Eumeta variegata TaxID=151549 RepID=A0A4C1XS78_EUMVA|nr:hypothetical protein EVAR_28608_1 [Eumeta japonica]
MLTLLRALLAFLALQFFEVIIQKNTDSVKVDGKRKIEATDEKHTAGVVCGGVQGSDGCQGNGDELDRRFGEVNGPSTTP